MPPKLAKTLNYLEGEHGILVQHLKDKFPPNTPDIEWIKKLAEDDGWFVITKDSNIKKNDHEKKAWEESGLQTRQTHERNHCVKMTKTTQKHEIS